MNMNTIFLIIIIILLFLLVVTFIKEMIKAFKEKDRNNEKISPFFIFMLLFIGVMVVDIIMTKGSYIDGASTRTLEMVFKLIIYPFIILITIIGHSVIKFFRNSNDKKDDKDE